MKRSGSLLYITLFFALFTLFKAFLQLRNELHDPTEAFKFFVSKGSASLEELNHALVRCNRIFRSFLFQNIVSTLLSLTILWKKMIPRSLKRLSFAKYDFLKTCILICGFVLLNSFLLFITKLLFSIDFSPHLLFYFFRLDLQMQLFYSTILYFTVAFLGRAAFLVIPLWVFLVQFFRIIIRLNQLLSRRTNFTWTSEKEKAIESLLLKIGFPVSRIFMSKEHNSAFYLGTFGRDSDSIISISSHFFNTIPVNELLAIVAHELGHWWHMDPVRRFIIWFIISFFLSFGLLIFFSRKNLTKAFGFEHASNEEDAKDKTGILYRLMPGAINPSHLVLIFFLFFSQATEIRNCVLNLVSQIAEFRADAFSAKHGFTQDQVSALIKHAGSSNVSMDPLFQTFMISHPSNERRIKRLLGKDKLSTD